MVLKTGRKALLAGLLASFAGLVCAADVARHALGAKKLALDPAGGAVGAGYYSGTTLSAVDTDLAAGNIKTGVTIFGVAGTLAAGASAPSEGGVWLLVPGSATLGTLDFYVQKYEARNVGNLPISQPSGTPWVFMTQAEAMNRCEALGPGYHLITMHEAQTISRNIEANGWNWTTGTVGSGSLWRGHTDNSPANTLAADITGDPDDDPYVGTGNTSPSIEKRVHQLSSGQYIWDWSGNLYEWLSASCSTGTGAGYWHESGVGDWNNVNLSDYEKARAGPAGAYTSGQSAGAYLGCFKPMNGIVSGVSRGGDWDDGLWAGVFTFLGDERIPGTGIGLRCAR